VTALLHACACVVALCGGTGGCRFLYDRTIKLERRERTRGLAAATVYDVLTLPEEEIDIGRAATLVIREERPDVDVEDCLSRLDTMAARLRRRLPEGTGVLEAVEQLVKVVQPEGILRPPARTRPTRDGFPVEIDIAKIADGAQGNCLGISLVYLAVAERVGLPVYGVSAPEHSFVRFDDGVTQVNIEPTLGGRRIPDKEYIKRRRISAESVDRGIYLRSESKRQVIASLLANRAGYRALAGQHRAAIEDAARALAVKPYWPQAYVNRGLAFERTGRRKRAEEDYHSALQLDPNCAGALNNLAALYVLDARSGSSRSVNSGTARSAEKMIQRALRLFPGRAEFRETAAAVAAALGKPREARRHLRRALELDPGNETYRRRLDELRRRSDAPAAAPHR
jgi:regulator of sirC expression with transglutaminase-like and TPR domain